jgi:D-glycero-alpha-D-manno-heptose-7-phosphate kinase
VYRRIVLQFLEDRPLAIKLSTIAEAPPGSGLGTSSTLVVSMVQAFTELLSLPLGEYEIAHLAYEIERLDCGLNGGKQDQYAATFGGFNFMEFLAEDRVIVNPLRVRESFLCELEASLVLYFGGVSRESARIIDDQQQRILAQDPAALAATHMVRKQAVHMKEAVLRGDIGAFADALHQGWVAKRNMAEQVSNPALDATYERARAAGALAGKVSGAGGGGFMIFVAEPERRLDVIGALTETRGSVYPCSFTERGATAWRCDRP